MKTLLTFIFISIGLISSAQTKENLIDCLEIIFSENSFEPAYNSDLTTNGNLIIRTPESNFRRSLEVTYRQIRDDLVQEDFYDSKHRIKVVREQEFEFTNIAESAILNIRASGDNSEVKFQLSTTITDELMIYTWIYILVKEQEGWKILKQSLTKKGTRIAPR